MTARAYTYTAAWCTSTDCDWHHEGRGGVDEVVAAWDHALSTGHRVSGDALTAAGAPQADRWRWVALVERAAARLELAVTTVGVSRFGREPTRVDVRVLGDREDAGRLLAELGVTGGQPGRGYLEAQLQTSLGMGEVRVWYRTVRGIL